MMKEGGMTFVTRLFKALANEKRLQILYLLIRKGPLTVGSISERLKFPIQTTSRHLNQLEKVGLVKTRQRRSWIYYQVAEKSPQVIRKTLFFVRDFYNTNIRF